MADKNRLYLLRFQQKSTRTSDGCAQELRNCFWHHLWREIWNRLQPSLQPELSQMKKIAESHAKTCTGWASFDIQFKDFWAICPWKVTQRLVLAIRPKIGPKLQHFYKFFLFNFQRSIICLMSIQQKTCEERIFQLLSMSNAIMCVSQSQIECVLSGLDIWLEHSEIKIHHAKIQFQTASFDDDIPLFIF